MSFLPMLEEPTTRPNVNYAKNWLDLLFLYSLGGTQQPFSVYYWAISGVVTNNQQTVFCYIGIQRLP